MSATANHHIYSWFLRKKVITYNCKKAEYKGEIELYTDNSYSRRVFKEDDEESKELIENVRNIIGDDTVITFKCMKKTSVLPIISEELRE